MQMLAFKAPPVFKGADHPEDFLGHVAAEFFKCILWPADFIMFDRSNTGKRKPN